MSEPGFCEHEHRLREMARAFRMHAETDPIDAEWLRYWPLDDVKQQARRGAMFALRAQAIDELLAQVAALTAQLTAAQTEAAALREALAKAEEERDEARAKHADLIYQVGKKYPGESRHDTAKRYIAEHEDCGRGGPAKSNAALAGQPTPGGQ